MTLTVENRGPDSGLRNLTDALVRACELDGDQLAFTYVDYQASKDGVAYSLTRAELYRRVCSVAHWLSDRCERGDRVAILAPQGLDYVVSFLGALHAGLIAVPLFSPDMPGHGDRLEAVLNDCAPSCALTSKDSFEDVRTLLRHRGGSTPCLAVDTLPDTDEAFVPPAIGPDDIAYLQYTSGSTRTPAGVVLTHANALANARQTVAVYCRGIPDTVTVSWLPLFHDMGLVSAVTAPLVGARRTVLMEPVAFVQRPSRWLRLMSENPGAVGAAPNFAYDYCATRISDKEKVWLDLSEVVSLINGAEPVHANTIRRFHDAFTECGLPPESHRPSFGLAEATLFVSGSSTEDEPTTVTFDRELLAAGTLVPVTDQSRPASELVGCGQPYDQQVAIVDPVARTVVDDGTVGEVWVHGPNTGRGYWGWDPAASAEVFDATLAQPVTGLPDAGWLRTGDLGAWYDGELFITGRMKDLIIVDGRNHYPQDVETTVEDAHPHVRKHRTAAFSVPVDNVERLVVVAEYSRGVPKEKRNHQEVVKAVSAAISTAHGVAPHDVLLVEANVVPRTSSGKVARRLCRERYLDSQLTAGSTQ